MRRLSLRMAVWAGALGLTLAGVAVWQYARVSRHALDGRLLEDARALTRVISSIDDVLEVELPAELRGTLAAEQSYYGVYDSTGRLLDGNAPDLPESGNRAPGLRSIDGHREALAAGPHGAIVRVGRSLAPLHADVQRLATSLLVASIVACLLAAPLTVWLRRELGRSMTQIDVTARGLLPGQPARIDLSRLDEEFVAVAGTLNEAFDRLERGLIREQQLTADASHELRTPVATIVTETEWALARPRSAEEYHETIEVCARQGRRLKELIETLLALARLEAGALAPTYERLNLETLVAQAVADVRPLADHRDVAMEWDGRGALHGDRVYLGILLSNLLTNAVRYNKAGGHVRVRVEEHPSDVALEVADTGPGLDPAVADRVFDRFWRASPSRAAREGGTGLGLAISKAIVDAHGGSISCRSSPEGTTFSVTLPRVEGDVAR